MMGRLSSELLIVSQEISEDNWDLELEEISSRERLKPCRRSFGKDQTVVGTCCFQANSGSYNA